jgi:hypothetical protein
MAATAFLVFYRFKAMSKEEAERAKGEWQNLKNGLPSGIELVGEYIHGFLLFESDSADSFLDWWSKFKDTIRWYVEQTHTIAARRR